MAVPKGKVSRARGAKRFASNFKATAPGVAECPHCHELKKNHYVCPNCGYYDGEQKVNNEKDKKESK